MRTMLMLLAAGCDHHEVIVDRLPLGDLLPIFPAVVGPEAAMATIDAGGSITAVVGLGDVDGDGQDDVAAVRSGGDAVAWRGAELSVAVAWFTVLDATAIAAAGDVDQDGLADFLAGNAAHWGLFRGSDLATGTFSIDDAFARFAPGAGRSLRAMAGGRDVDGDGVPDLVSSEYQPDSGRAREEVRVLSGSSITAGVRSVQTGEGAYGAVVDDDGSGPATLTLFGDVDRDELADIATGGVRNFAAVHLGSSVGGSSGLSDQEVHLHTCHPEDTCPNGVAVGQAGDVDGDGIDDLLASAFPDGVSYVIPGLALANDVYKTQLFGGTLAIEHAIEGARTLVGPGDLDDSGFSEVVATDGRVAWLMAGNQLTQSTVDVDEALSRFEGFASEAALIVGAPGDVDGDGHPDLAFADAAAGTLRIVLTPR